MFTIHSLPKPYISIIFSVCPLIVGKYKEYCKNCISGINIIELKTRACKNSGLNDKGENIMGKNQDNICLEIYAGIPHFFHIK